MLTIEIGNKLKSFFLLLFLFAIIFIFEPFLNYLTQQIFLDEIYQKNKLPFF